METTLRARLSLEEGAAHLTQLLRSMGRSTPSPLRDRALSWMEAGDLSHLFTEQVLKEDWKYTPMDLLRQRWDYVPFEYGQPFGVAGDSLSDPRESLDERNPAIQSFPEPLSPWEALLAGAAHQRHFMLADGEPIGVALRNPGAFAAQLFTAIVPESAVGEVWFSLEGEGLSLVRWHLHVQRGGRLRFYYPSPRDSGESYRYLILTAYVEEDATIETYELHAATAWMRSEMRIQLGGQRASAHLHGATQVTEGAFADTAIRVEHRAPHTESNQLFKSLVEAGGRRAFQGRIFVSRAAQKTNAYQSHKALLTAPSAVSYSRPQLEIFADDVRCTHGVTTGFLQGDMLFYLQARGIPEEKARSMLHRAFLAEVVEKVPHAALRTWAEEYFTLPKV